MSLFNQRPGLFPQMVGPSCRAGLGYEGQGEGCALSSQDDLASFLATSVHPVPAQPLRTHPWPFSGFQQDTIFIVQNKGSAFLTQIFGELNEVLAPEKCTCTHECGELRKPHSPFLKASGS